MVALRARVQDAEARLENLQGVREDLDCLRDRVWDLPRQLGGDVDRLRGRCSRGEENDEQVRQSLERHLAWFRDLYDRMGYLEAHEPRRVAARARAPDPAPAPARSCACPASLGRSRSDDGECLSAVFCDAVGSSVSAAPAGR
ncbi:hypothetical protein PF008_g31120 [Phytophthora fragariae]|uniref:Uncharacterized protein n=1 Tax=Phytophthora fragariae TaxID=53985 RepID=A0A6G0Q3N2_9STRA|nr:hypothetical protein PF008_g31120 [Phytophthora fragariae]